MQSGRRWVVDIDLEKFFDRVNHDMLMGRVAHHIADGRVLTLIRRYLDAVQTKRPAQRVKGTAAENGGGLTAAQAQALAERIADETS